MHFEQISRTVRSLSFRLTTWSSLVVILVGVAALYSSREGLRYSLIHETDLILRDEVEEIVLSVQELSPDQDRIKDVLDRKAESHLEHGWFVQLLDHRRRAVWESSNLPESVSKLPVPQGTVSQIVPLDGYLVAQREIPVNGKPLYWIRVGTPTRFIDADVDRVTRWMLAAAVVIMLLSPLGGYILARRAVEPLREIIDTTKGLHPSNFDDRLPMRGTGDELDQLSEEINDFLDQIADHLDRQHDFLANAAHELRSPLTAIQGTLDVALSRKRSVEEYEEILPTVIDECSRLRTLVNQLLVLAENDADGSQARHQPLLLDRVVQKTVDMFAGVAGEKSVRLVSEADEEVVVRGLAPHLRQVVANLIDNAVKFTPAGGTVTVSLGHSPDGRSAVLRVRDTGVGIPPADVPRVFDRFYRGDKAHQHAEGLYGSGLGLSICASIIAAHSGKIEVASEIGRGTVFTVTLPAEGGPSESPAELQHAKAVGGPENGPGQDNGDDERTNQSSSELSGAQAHATTEPD